MINHLEFPHSKILREKAREKEMYKGFKGSIETPEGTVYIIEAGEDARLEVENKDIKRLNYESQYRPIKGSLFEDYKGPSFEEMYESKWVGEPEDEHMERLDHGTSQYRPVKDLKGSIATPEGTTYIVLGREDEDEHMERADYGTPQYRPVKDSGKRVEYESGMKRDVQDDKPDFTLLFPEGVAFNEQPLTILAHHLRLGAQKYGRRNWEKANSKEELDRFKQSALRHLLQALSGEDDENHLSAVMFNIIAWMYTEERIGEDK